MAQENKIIYYLRKKIEGMTEEELNKYVGKFGLAVPKGGVDDAFLTVLHESIRKNTVISSPRYTPFEYGLRKMGEKNHWQGGLNNSDFKITKPIIICLPGNGVIDSKKANGFCKLIDGLVGASQHTSKSKDGAIDILGVSYGRDSHAQTAGDINKQESSEFVSKLLMPLCVDKNNNRLKLDKVCANMTLITFCTHCYGATALVSIMKALSQQLAEVGFSKEDVKKIKSSLCQIAYSAYTNNAPVPTIRIDSMTDSHNMSLANNFKKVYGYELNGVAIQYDKEGMFRNAPSSYDESQEILSIYSSRLLNVKSNRDLSKLIDEHTIEYLERGDKWKLTDKSKRAKNADIVSYMMAYSIAWSVAKSIEGHEKGKLQSRNNLDKQLAPDLLDITKIYTPEELMM